MNAPMLWTARLVPPALIAVNALGLVALGGEVAPLAGWGSMLVISAWVALALYSSVMWLRGDYIQRALNMKPFLGGGDEIQREAARRASTLTYMTVLFLLGGVIGIFLGEFPMSDGSTSEATARSGHMLYAWVGFVAFTGSAMPTAAMAWAMRPLPEDDEALADE
jgi:hypothetical protein